MAIPRASRRPWTGRGPSTPSRRGSTWRQVAPAEGQYRWDLLDAQLAWARRNRLAIEAGPLIEFRKGALPDWLWLWEGDFETIGGLVADYVRQAVSRYKGKVPLWHVVHRAAGGEILGLTEEEQVRIAARAVQVARQADPAAQVTIGVDRPWAEWMGSSHFQLGPLHLCDYLLRAELGISGIALEIAPGYSAPGSHIRDLFEFSKLLDLYSLLNVPLHLWMVMPSGRRARPARRAGDPRRGGPVAGAAGRVDPGQLGRAVDRPGHRQAVRPHRDLAPGERRDAARLPARRPDPPRPDRQAAGRLAPVGPRRNPRVRSRCHRPGAAL